MGFYGSKLDILAAYPDEGSAIEGPDRVRPSTDAVDHVSAAPFDAVWDFTDRRIVITAAENGPLAEGTDPGGFNGWILQDVRDSLPDFAFAEIVPSGTTSVFSNGQITVSDDRITLNYVDAGGFGLPYFDGDTITIRVGFDRFSGTGGGDRIVGTKADNEISGGGGADTLIGRGGADRIDGGRGTDLLRGGSGGDRLDGGAGGDRLIGNGGTDLIEGGKGNDWMKGGGAADVFVFAQARTGSDRVADYNDDRDSLDVSGWGAESLSDLAIDQDGADTLISYGRNEIRLLGIDSADFDADTILLG